MSTHFTVVTGHEDPAKDRTDVDWDALARAGGTLVILMGAGRIGEIARRLIEGGRAPDTPVAAVRNGTRPDQTTVRATLATIADAGVKAPSAIVVGDVAALDLSWFEARPAVRPHDRGRPAHASRSSGLRLRLEELGAEVLELPAIEITPHRVHRPRPRPRTSGWCSRRPTACARFFHDGLAPAGLDARALAGVRLAAIGPGTAHALDDARPARRPDPRALRGRVAARGVPARRRHRARGCSLARAEVARDVLPEGLAERGYAVDVLPVYRTRPATPDPALVAARRRGPVRRGDVHVVVDGRQLLLARSTLAPTPSRSWSRSARSPPPPRVERGLRVDAEAEEHTIDGLVTTLLARFGVAGAG